MNCEVYEYCQDEKYHTHAQYIWILHTQIVFAIRSDGMTSYPKDFDVWSGNLIRNNIFWRRIV